MSNNVLDNKVINEKVTNANMINTTRPSRLEAVLKNVTARGDKGLIAYIAAGDPDLDTTVQLAVAMAGAGVDVLELGVPFSDPVADGPSIQAAYLRALEGGVSLKGILEAVKKIKAHTDMPLVLMTYYNPVYQYGLREFASQAAEAGVRGLIVPDLPPEEAGPLLEAADEVGLDLVPLVTPNTPARRLEKIAAMARGFIYCVSVNGVTGERVAIKTNLSALTGAVRGHSPLPVALGFGISKPSQASLVAQNCDAVVVGSALVNIINHHDNRSQMIDAVCRRVREFKAALTGPGGEKL